MTDIAIKSNARLEKCSPLLFAPLDYLEQGGHKIIYGLKQGLYAIGKITEIPSPYASVVRKITECVGPALAFFGNCMAQWNNAAKSFVGAVEAIDLLEIINDANYFVNGGFAKDRAKKHYYSVAAHIALVPADIITVVLYMKTVFNFSFKALGACAAAIGNFRVFGFVPKLAQLVQNWPVFRSIPNLTGKAAWIGNIRVFGFMTRISLATVALVAVTGAYVYMTADAWHRKSKYQKKTDKYANKLLNERNIVVKPGDNCLKKMLKKAGIEDQHPQRLAIGRDMVKYKHNLIKAKQAKIDLFAAGSEVALKGAALAGLTAGATVAASVTFGILGAFAFVCVGYSLYHKLTTSKPDLRAII